MDPNAQNTQPGAAGAPKEDYLDKGANTRDGHSHSVRAVADQFYRSRQG
jgi:hypothetical protein